MTLTLIDEEPLPHPFQHHLAGADEREGSRIRVGHVRYAMDDGPFEGFLALDAARPAGSPAVLLLHAWNGIGPSIQMRAQMLARLGYVAFAADLYGAGIRPQVPAECHRVSAAYYDDLPLLTRRVQAGLDALVRVTGVAPENVTVAGYCFGGTAALEFARTGAPVAGTVSFHGRLLPHTPADAGRTRSPLLIVTGAADELVPDAAVVRLMAELRTAPALHWEVDLHSGAPHAFTVPGTEAFRPLADARSWGRFRQFLAETNPS